jgi:outer membrane protein assembly factor BamE (lipoprotein component of BamABCDE complex)
MLLMQRFRQSPPFVQAHRTHDPMKSSRKLLLSSAALVALALCGCTTPEARIQKNPEVFAHLAPEQQALVKAGQVGVGFDMDAVKLALGNPDRITVHTTSKGQTQIWHYVTYESFGGPMYFGGYYGGFGGYGRRGFRGGWGGGWGGWGYPMGLDYPSQAHDHYRITFDTNGRVVSIQEEMS